MKDIKKVRDLTGQKFGRLTVIGLDDKKDTRKTYWVCQCDCGSISSHRSDGLLGGSVTSCGCRKREISAINVSKNHKHKQSGTRLYGIWQNIKARCENEHDLSYGRYGARGITVCDEWKNDFSAFYEWSVNNGYKDSLTIDRVDNNKGYSPDNCRWATASDQARNRRSNINITIGNSTKTLTEWCEIFKLNYSAINARYKRNGFVSVNDLFN